MAFLDIGEKILVEVACAGWKRAGTARGRKIIE